MNDKILEFTIEKLIEINPKIEHISSELKDLMREAEFESAQVFTIALLADAAAKNVLSEPLDSIRNLLKIQEELNKENINLIASTSDEVNRLKQEIKSFLVEFVDNLNSQFESENINIKINLEIT